MDSYSKNLKETPVKKTAIDMTQHKTFLLRGFIAGLTIIFGESLLSHLEINFQLNITIMTFWIMSLPLGRVVASVIKTVLELHSVKSMGKITNLCIVYCVLLIADFLIGSIIANIVLRSGYSDNQLLDITYCIVSSVLLQIAATHIAIKVFKNVLSISMTQKKSNTDFK